MFAAYGLYNYKAKKLYVGQTSNLEKRLHEHNSKIGNHFTAKFDGDWELIYKELVATRSEALIREKELKSHRGRDYLKTYIR